VQRKAHGSGVVVLLAALLLAGCTGSPGDDGRTDAANPGSAGTATPAAEPGKYRTLPEPCGAVARSTLDSLLPGIKQLTDEEQREKAYAGEPTLTYDTDRKVGCRWKVDSADATNRLLIDFERVVSYEGSVSDDSQAELIFAEKQAAADLPEPTASGTVTETSSPTPGNSPSSTASSPSSASASPSTAASGLQPRVLDDLGDEAFLDDALSTAGSTAQQRTVTVAFRTSNVIVTIVYEEQPATVGTFPDSAEMQDRARKLAAQLDDTLTD
jgi:hypothetical protein